MEIYGKSWVFRFSSEPENYEMDENGTCLQMMICRLKILKGTSQQQLGAPAHQRAHQSLDFGLMEKSWGVIRGSWPLW